jgi:hypothetical protein
MSYGNGLMRVGSGGRSYLHHTGGMVSFSSSFHVDLASGAGAFASASVSAFLEYRPRLLTNFAVDALTNAAAGRPPPPAPSLLVGLANPGSYVGAYSGPAGELQVVPGEPLTLAAGGETAELQPWGGESFRTTHPRFRQFTLKFERTSGAVTAVSWGPNTFVRQGSGAAQPVSDPALARLAGRYLNDSPWWEFGAIVVERGGKLWLGTDTQLTRLGDNLWRVGDEVWSPERASFGDFVEGRPQSFIYSGEKFLRRDI